MQNQNITLTELIARTTEYLFNLNYSRGTISHYCNTWNLLKKYASSKGILTFSLNLGMQFLSDYYGIIPDAKLPHFHVSLMRRIKVLEEFKNTSRFCLCHQKNLKKVPKQFEEVFNCYQKLCYDVQLVPRTIQSKSFRITNFLIYLNKEKINNFRKLSIAHIYDYVKSLKNYSSAIK